MRASEGAAATAAQRLRVQAKAPPPAAARRRWLLSTGALSRPATVVARSTTSKHRPAVTRRLRERQGDEQGALRLPAAPPSTKKPEVPLSTKKLEVPPSIKKSTSPRRRCPASAASAASSAFVAAATAAVAAMSDTVAALLDAVVPAVLSHARADRVRQMQRRQNVQQMHAPWVT